MAQDEILKFANEVGARQMSTTMDVKFTLTQLYKFANAIKSSGGEACSEVTHVDVLPDNEGMYEHRFKFNDRLGCQTPIYIDAPAMARIAELEAKCKERKEQIDRFTLLVDKRDHEVAELTAKCEKMREAICIYSREMLGDINFESDEQAINYMLSFTEENPHGKELEECK